MFFLNKVDLTIFYLIFLYRIFLSMISKIVQGEIESTREKNKKKARRLTFSCFILVFNPSLLNFGSSISNQMTLD